MLQEDKAPAAPQVLIVGAGPAGLALAIELGQRGVRCLVIERNDRVGYAPRAKTTNVRTREHLRRWGIAEPLRAASPLGLHYPSNIVFCIRLNGPRLGIIENAMYCAPGKNPLYSEHAQWIPQYTVEEVLRAHAQSLPSVSLRFSCELQQFEQAGDRVTARLKDLSGPNEGSEFELACDYLVGADGARSTVRSAIGAKMEGTYGLSRNYNVVFRAPGLAQAHAHGPAIMYWQINGEVPSLLGPMDSDDRWFFMPTHLPPDQKLSGDEAAALIRRATGLPELQIEVLSSDEWVASRLLADRYADRRVFLVGDACHLHPPFGGYGMNMGVADGVDLGWKLAAVLQGWGGPALPGSYERERRPVHNFVMDEAVANHAVLGNQLWQDGLEDDDAAGAELRRAVGSRIEMAKMREFNTLGVVLGYRYDDSPVIVPDGSPAPEHDFVNYVPSARPGALAPHAWLHDGSSLYDHFGQGFTLLCTHEADAGAMQAAQDAARRAGVPLTLVQPKERVLQQLYGARYTLVRPDQHVAWRGDEWPADGLGLFRRVCGH